MKKTFLIEFASGDGTGKETQSRMLLASYRAQKRDAVSMDFPGYQRNLVGGHIRDCIDGKYGDFLKVDPKTAAILYAADRVLMKDEINKHLNAGITVIVDRYVSSNILHQAVKFDEGHEKEDFIGWVENLEYEELNIPRPQVTLYLDMPVKFSQQLITKRGGGDTSERDIIHQEKVRVIGDYQCNHEAHWHRIVCVQNDVLLRPEQIHGRVIDTLQQLKMI